MELLNIEAGLWFFSSAFVSIMLILLKYYIHGASYIAVGVLSLLALYLAPQYGEFSTLHSFIEDFWVLQVLTFLNVINGYSLYARYRRTS
jgi:hypothetical protein